MKFTVVGGKSTKEQKMQPEGTQGQILADLDLIKDLAFTLCVREEVLEGS